MNPASNWDDDPMALDGLSASARQQVYDAARAAGCDSAALDDLDLPQLRELARREGLQPDAALGRQELQSLLLKHRCAQHGLAMTSGVLEVLPDGYGFLRSPGHDFQAGADDVYVSPNQVHRLGLRTGNRVAGPVRLPRRGEQYVALLRVETVDGAPLDQLQQRVPFEHATPVLPRRRLLLRPAAGDLTVRAVQLLSPWGHGQRVLVASPPGAGRTRLLAALVGAAIAGNPELQAIVCLVDERPEDVTEFRRTAGAAGRCQVVATTFDAPPQRHLALAEMALMQSQRLVESGRDVLLVVDSLTALVRASQHDQPYSGRVLTPGLEPQALLRAKRIFAAGRSLEGGAALTVLGSVLTGTDSRIDQIVAEEFAGKGNADLVLDRALAAQHVSPALDVLATGTRREDSLIDAAARQQLNDLRTALRALPPRERLERVLALLADPQLDPRLQRIADGRE